MGYSNDEITRIESQAVPMFEALLRHIKVYRGTHMVTTDMVRAVAAAIGDGDDPHRTVYDYMEE